MAESVRLEAEVPAELSGLRLDQIAAKLFPEYSRSRLQAWVKSGELLVDGERKRTRDKLLSGAVLAVVAEVEDEGRWQPENIDLDIVYEDETLLVINKPAGLVVHPAAGHSSGTLLNALLNHCEQLGSVPRAGIVHRLDKDTTGLMVVAKNLAAHSSLVEQLQARTVSREYEAVATGVMTGGGTVEVAIGRHAQQRQKMAVVNGGGKEAITHYRLIERFANHSHIRVKLETGRTHQIRVHMAHLHYPLIGDTVYGGRQRLPKNASPELIEVLRGFSRQALHAQSLALIHPDSEALMQWQVPLPDDLVALLEALRKYDVNIAADDY